MDDLVYPIVVVLAVGVNHLVEIDTFIGFFRKAKLLNLFSSRRLGLARFLHDGLFELINKSILSFLF